MAVLEDKLDSIDVRLRAVDAQLDEISSQLALLANKIPSWWQAQLSAAGLFALMVAGLVILK